MHTLSLQGATDLVGTVVPDLLHQEASGKQGLQCHGASAAGGETASHFVCSTDTRCAVVQLAFEKQARGY